MGESARQAVELGALNLRRVAESDLDTLARIEHDTFSDPWSRHAFAVSAASPDTLCTVAEEECADVKRVIAYSVVRRAADEAELLNLAVDASRRRRGLGSVLIERAVADAKAQGARAIFLEVRESNHAARALYKAAGFELVGRRREYYRRPAEDALILRRVLI